MHLMTEIHISSFCNVFQRGGLCHALNQSVHIAVGGLALHHYRELALHTYLMNKVFIFFLPRIRVTFQA